MVGRPPFLPRIIGLTGEECRGLAGRVCLDAGCEFDTIVCSKAARRPVTLWPSFGLGFSNLRDVS